MPDSETDSLPVVPKPAGTTSALPADVETSVDSETSSSIPAITFQGNSYDLVSVVGVTIGGITLLSCATCNLGFYCLPLLPIILGAIGLVAAKDSVDPERTKFLSWISLGSGAVILLLILLFVAAYIILIAFAVATESGNGF